VQVPLSQLPFGQQFFVHPQFLVQVEQQGLSLMLFLVVPLCARADNAISIAEPAITNLRFIIISFKI
jgi:hypothetical protein